jgi:beta-glucosidase
VKEGQAASVMGAYNRTNGEPCCASLTLLDKILRQEWGFDGYVVSDCWAIGDIYKHHKVVATVEEAAALAVQSGCDLNCGEAYGALLAAVAQGLIADEAPSRLTTRNGGDLPSRLTSRNGGRDGASEETIDRAVQRLFTARFRLGLFDPPEMVPYAQIPFAVNDSPAHRALALQAARESIILLKNQNHCLPLRPDLQAIAVIGPNADDATVLLGNYHGTPSRSVTPREGIQARVSPATAVLYALGCDLLDENTAGFAEAVALAGRAEVVIFVGGISQQVEGEEGQREGVGSGMRSRGDRADLNLPGAQEQLLQALHATGKPVILVLLNGSALAVNWAHEHLPAIVEAWYPGEEGGTALAEVLFGDYNPGGRLPVTFYKSLADLPPFEDYRMEGRTYRYFRGEPLFPFGYGLSYTTFAYSHLRLSARTIAPSETLTVSVDVQNVGERAGDEVVQLYTSDVAASVPVPIRQLGGFARIHLAPGEGQTVTFTLTPRQLSLIDDAGRRVIEPGEFQLAVGGHQPRGPSPGPQSQPCVADFVEKSAAVLFGSFAVVEQVTAVSGVNG